MGYSLDCVLVDIIGKEIPIHYFRIIWANIIPCFFTFIFLLGCLIIGLLVKINHFCAALYTSLIFIILWAQPSIFSNCINLLSCLEIGGV